MESLLVNTAVIVEIKRFKEQKSDYVWYPERKKTFWNDYKPAGYYIDYDRMFERYMSESVSVKVSNGYVLKEDKDLWIKCGIKFTMSNKETYYKYFDTLEERDGYIETLINHYKLNLIII